MGVYTYLKLSITFSAILTRITNILSDIPFTSAIFFPYFFFHKESNLPKPFFLSEVTHTV